MGKIMVWSFGTLLVIGLLGAFAFWSFRRTMEKKNADVDEMCRLPVNTPVEQVIPKALALGFTVDPDFSLPSGIEVYAADGSGRLKWTDETLPGVQAGSILVGKVLLPPFMRRSCEIRFENRVVVGTRKINLD